MYITPLECLSFSVYHLEHLLISSSGGLVFGNSVFVTLDALKITFFWLCSNFAPAKHYQWGLLWLFLAKVLVETWGLRRASYFFSKMPWKGFFVDKIRSFEPSWMPKRPQSDPICIAIGVYYPFGLFEGHFELFSASSGAVGNFSQWRSCFWQICVCHFGCLKNDIFLGFAPSSHQLNIINGVCFEYF